MSQNVRAWLTWDKFCPCQENPSFPVKNQKIEDNGQLHAQEAAECHREGWQYSIPPSISQRALQPNKEIFQPDQSVSRSCMYCNIVQWLNTVGVSISVFAWVSYVHMILENFCKTSGVVCEIYSLLRVMSYFANLAFSVWKQSTEMKLCKVGLYWTSIEHIFSAVNFKHSLLVCDSVFSN